MLLQPVGFRCFIHCSAFPTNESLREKKKKTVNSAFCHFNFALWEAPASTYLLASHQQYTTFITKSAVESKEDNRTVPTLLQNEQTA